MEFIAEKLWLFILGYYFLVLLVLSIIIFYLFLLLDINGREETIFSSLNDLTI